MTATTPLRRASTRFEIRPVASAVWSDDALISVFTTAKPRPASRRAPPRAVGASIVIDQHGEVVRYFKDRAGADMRLDLGAEGRFLEQRMPERIEQETPHVLLEYRADRSILRIDDREQAQIGIALEQCHGLG